MLRHLISSLIISLFDAHKSLLKLARKGSFHLVLAHLNFPFSLLPQFGYFISHILDCFEILGRQYLSLVAPFVALGALLVLAQSILKL